MYLRLSLGKMFLDTVTLFSSRKVRPNTMHINMEHCSQYKFSHHHFSRSENNKHDEPMILHLLIFPVFVFIVFLSIWVIGQDLMRTSSYCLCPRTPLVSWYQNPNILKTSKYIIHDSSRILMIYRYANEIRLISTILIAI